MVDNQALLKIVISMSSFILLGIIAISCIVSSERKAIPIINGFRERLDTSFTKDSLISLREDIMRESVDNRNRIKLAFPADISEMLFIIDERLKVINHLQSSKNA